MLSRYVRRQEFELLLYRNNLLCLICPSVFVVSIGMLFSTEFKNCDATETFVFFFSVTLLLHCFQSEMTNWTVSSASLNALPCFARSYLSAHSTFRCSRQRRYGQLIQFPIHTKCLKEVNPVSVEPF